MRREEEGEGEGGCRYWLDNKNRFCANRPLLPPPYPYCGNHSERSIMGGWIQCPIDPSHKVLVENVEAHKKKCPLLKQANSLSLKPYYHKSINSYSSSLKEEEEEEEEDGVTTSQMKRDAVCSMTRPQLSHLLTKIRSLHSSLCPPNTTAIPLSYKTPQACHLWINRLTDRKLPFQEKHVQQQASILGNLEDFGVIKNNVASQCDDSRQQQPCSEVAEAVVEFGAGRGYLTQVLADCYGFNKVFLVERKAYKLKADRSLRQIKSLMLERLRIDIEDLKLSAVESLQGVPYLAIGKHLCGPATDMTLRCCLGSSSSIEGSGRRVGGELLRGLAIATCCHHLCQWKHYINKSYLTNLGISKDEFHALTWFTSWAVDADHSSVLSAADDLAQDRLPVLREKKCEGEEKEDFGGGVIKELRAVERAAIGFMCKDIIDMGRLMWLKQQQQLEAQLVKYVPSNISPENNLLIAKPSFHTM